jgi:hypothetical protein
MIRLLYLIIFTFSGHLFADDKIVSSLEANDFKCNNLKSDNCSYTECRGRVPSYPLEMLISVPAEANGLKIHFHGHILNKFPQYERDLSEMVKSFNLNKSLCVSRNIVVFPKSEGNCKTYDLHLKDNQTILKFFLDLENAIGFDFQNLSLSAHSGGGRTVARFLKSSLSVSDVSIYDGIYSENDKKIIQDWYLKSNGLLKLSAVKGMTPERMSIEIAKKISSESTIIKTKIGEVTFEKLESERFQFFNRISHNEDLLKSHYKILEETWPIYESSTP